MKPKAFANVNDADGKHLYCYFCRPDAYPVMPAYRTLCACCGEMIITPDDDDPMNEAMRVCLACEQDLMAVESNLNEKEN